MTRAWNSLIYNLINHVKITQPTGIGTRVDSIGHQYFDTCLIITNLNFRSGYAGRCVIKLVKIAKKRYINISDDKQTNVIGYIQTPYLKV